MDKIYKIDLVVILVSTFILIFLVGYMTPKVIAPLNNYESSDGQILFSIENADKLLIDDNIDFTTPDEYNIRDGLIINLYPGTYYWKAVGVFQSEIRTLVINSEVSLEIRSGDDGFEVVNAGNVRLNVEVYDEDRLVDEIKLGPGEGVEGEDGDVKYRGGLDD